MKRLLDHERGGPAMFERLEARVLFDAAAFAATGSSSLLMALKS